MRISDWSSDVCSSDLFDTISLVLRWQLWDSGSRSAQRHHAAAQRAELEMRREDLQRRLELARRAASEDLATALRAVGTGSARLAAAEEGFRIAERKRDAAALSQLEFLDAERALRAARLKLAHMGRETGRESGGQKVW